ncbi:sarcalumenin [Copidosoma floridanum]|uniref:sarcalumenin n=1 Tax=Copidosoma floridanum TaxID=29053 RepID=UPI0006C945D3|nr:sarcalumenin [Copidosoma floridanum]
MTGSTRTRPAILLVAGLLLGLLLAVTLQGVQGEELEKVPSEDQCRPYIEKALKDLGTEGSEEQTEDADDEHDEGPAEESAADANENDEESEDGREKRDAPGVEDDDQSDDGDGEAVSAEVEGSEEPVPIAEEDEAGSKEAADLTEEDKSEEKEGETEEQAIVEEEEEEVAVVEEEASEEEQKEGSGKSGEDEGEPEEEKRAEGESGEEGVEQQTESVEEDKAADSGEQRVSEEDSGEEKKEDSGEKEEEEGDKTVEEEKEAVVVVEEEPEPAAEAVSKEEEEAKEGEKSEKSAEAEEEEVVKKEEAGESLEVEAGKSGEGDEGESQEEASGDAGSGEVEAEGDGVEEESRPEEEELIMEIEIPEILRPRDHVNQLLKLDEENEDKERAVERVADVILRDLKRLYDNAIKPLETLYKYRDLSNRHFGDPEIFSKPLVLFMGPWSGGKSSIINYLLDMEYKATSLRTGAEPSPAYFNILMHGEEEEVLDGTQLAADWTFSGLQKFGQGLLDRLKGYKLKNKLLEKVNIVEIPGILEIRKQVQRLFPFNDACQWFIDRADIIFLVYDPSKLDVGPETEAILDQLKGREYQTRIILNKADQVKPEELMRVQGALIWNISPLMSSAEPPIMYSASLWSIPYEAGAPTRLLYAQERAFLRDLRTAIDKRVEHKIASARRFAVRVRNHAKMVDCYLTTYYNQKSFFAKKKDTSDRIIESPQDYHIYEGLSTLTNISRYDLPDPDVYRDFFRLNSLYEFPLLSSTCTYFRGCPINRLDVAIAYDLPELVGKYKRATVQQDDSTSLLSSPPAPLPASPKPETPDAANQKKQPARSGASRLSFS